MIILIFTIIIILKALTDALFYKGKKRLSKYIEELWLIILLIFAFNHRIQAKNEYIHIIMMYVFLRAAIFDALFNVFAKLPIFFKGSTSDWDIFLDRFKTWQYIVLKLFCLAIAILIYTKTLI